ncbi:hypothetical protein AOLI_G00248560 [Acnodon oligacanthus]
MCVNFISWSQYEPLPSLAVAKKCQHPSIHHLLDSWSQICSLRMGSLKGHNLSGPSAFDTSSTPSLFLQGSPWRYGPPAICHLQKSG